MRSTRNTGVPASSWSALETSMIHSLSGLLDALSDGEQDVAGLLGSVSQRLGELAALGSACDSSIWIAALSSSKARCWGTGPLSRTSSM